MPFGQADPKPFTQLSVGVLLRHQTPSVIPAKESEHGFRVLRSTQPGMTNLASVIPAKAGIQRPVLDSGFFAPLSPE